MDVQVPHDAQLWINDILVWIGYGTVIGLLGKAVMPGRDPGGAIATLAMGIVGVVIGCGVWTMVIGGERVTPISPVGLVCGTTGSLVILTFYRVLGGYWQVGRSPHPPRYQRPVRRRGYRTVDSLYED
jgi:uncharacterized membrane protein YeaQ/YmgE (transglycosylase-associated protein family)